MRIIKDLFQKDLVLTESCSLIGEVIGNVILRKKCNLQVHGKIIGNLMIEFDSEAYIHGTVCGDIENHGQLYIYGQVFGDINSERGILNIDRRAKLKT